MRIMTLDFTERVSRETDELVEKVIKSYNSKPQNQHRLAIRGGKRRPRKPAEQRVLDKFELK